MIALRNLQPSDVHLLLEWRNGPDVAQYMFTNHVISVAEHETWFANVLQDARRQYWVITCDGHDLGLTSLDDLDMANRRCSWAIYLAEESARGKGVGSAAEFLALTHAFESLFMNRLSCTVLATNKRMIDLQLGFGLREEGRMKQYVLRDDGPMDAVLFAILREEWLALKDGIAARLTRMGLI